MSCETDSHVVISKVKISVNGLINTFTIHMYLYITSTTSTIGIIKITIKAATPSSGASAHSESASIARSTGPACTQLLHPAFYDVFIGNNK